MDATSKETQNQQEFTYWFETDEGVTSGEVFAADRDAALAALLSEFPDDAGSDGEFTDTDGETFAIEW